MTRAAAAGKKKQGQKQKGPVYQVSIVKEHAGNFVACDVLGPHDLLAHEDAAEWLREAGVPEQHITVKNDAAFPVAVSHDRTEFEAVPVDGTSRGKALSLIKKQLLIKPWALKRHQERLRQHFENCKFQNKKEQLDFLLMWEMGVGKTRGVLETLARAKEPPRTVLILCKNVVIDYWLDNVRQTPVQAPMRVYIMGITEFMNNRDHLARKADALIFDESQAFRNLTPNMYVLLDLMRQVPKRFYLSGTPIMNSRHDVRGLLYSMGEDITPDVDNTGVFWDDDFIAFEDGEWPEKRLKQVLAGKVSYYSPRHHAELDYKLRFPDTQEHVIRLPISVAHALDNYMQRGNVELTHPTNGETATLVLPKRNCYNKEQIMNLNDADPVTGTYLKVQAILHLLRAVPQNKDATCAQPSKHETRVIKAALKGVPKLSYPCVIYTTYIEKGVKLLEACLKHSVLEDTGKSPRIATLTGETRLRQRQQIVNAYNRGKLDIMIFSSASAEGTNLKGTASMISMEPQNNLETWAQTKARAIRLDSHAGGHKETVQFYKFLCTFPMEAIKAGKVATKAEADWVHGVFAKYFPVFEECDIVEKLAILHKALEDVEGGESVNEKFDRRNAMKQVEVEHMLDVIRGCSIDMPKGTMNEGKWDLEHARDVLFDADSTEQAKYTKAIKSRIQTLKKHLKPLWEKQVPKGAKLATFSKVITTAIEKVLHEMPSFLQLQPRVAAEHPSMKPLFDKTLKPLRAQFVKDQAALQREKAKKEKEKAKRQKEREEKKCKKEQEKAAREKAKKEREKAKAAKAKAKAAAKKKTASSTANKRQRVA